MSKLKLKLKPKLVKLNTKGSVKVFIPSMDTICKALNGTFKK